MPEVDVPVQFGSISIGDATARLGCKISRQVMGVVQADSLFSATRLTGRVVLGGADEDAGQGRILDDDQPQIVAAFDSKQYAGQRKWFSFGLTFNLASIDVKELSGFAKRSGRLIVDAIAELPESAEDDEEDDDREPAAGSLFSKQEDWRAVPLDTLFEGRILKAFKGGGLDTLGALTDWQAKKGDYWAIDLKGIGSKAQEEIDARLLAFWRDNPQYATAEG